MVFWKFIDNQIHPIYETDQLGFPIGTEILSNKYIQNVKEIALYRSCHAFGDWAMISAFPRLIKQKYPDKSIFIPSESLINRMFGYMKNNWNSWSNPFKNAQLVFKNNPYIDGEFNSFEGEILSDHYQIYDPKNLYEPIVNRLLRVYHFLEEEIIDSLPELYFSQEEIYKGDTLIQNIPTYYSLIITEKHKFGKKDNVLLELMKQYNCPCLYWSATPIENTPYNSIKNKINIKDLTNDLRIQLYIRSKAQANFGTQTGVNDVMVRYTPVYVIPHENYNFTAGDFLKEQYYIN
jgi:hypothetical protein